MTQNIAMSSRPFTGKLVTVSGIVLILAAIGIVAITVSRTGASRSQQYGFVLQKPEFLKIAKKLDRSDNPFLGRWQISVYEDNLEKKGLSVGQKIELHRELAWHLLRLGNPVFAAEHIEAALTLATEPPISKPQLIKQLHLMLATAYLRKAEVANCIERHNSECCIFPLRGGGVHDDTAPAKRAKETYLTYLQLDPDDLRVRWLLNVVCMALAEYPAGVPDKYLIPPEAFESEVDVGRFVDVAPKIGIDTFNLCGGAIVDDFDGDNLLDIVTSTYDPLGPLTFYRNLGKGLFEDASESSHLNDQLGGLNCLGADYDSDGDIDVLVLRGAWLFAEGRIRNSLLRNNGDGTFTDVTRDAGLAEPAYPTQAAVWGDFDNDGHLDLYIGNEGMAEAPPKGDDYPSQLFHNNGDGTFTDIAAQAGAANHRYCKGITAGDYDNDGDLDLYVSNIGVNRLYRNNGDLTFTDVAEELGVTEPTGRSFATWFFDYNNDNHLDLFVAAYDATTGDLAADYLGLAHNATPPCLYRNDGQGVFTNVTLQAGLDHPYLPMGANFGDIDNDGYLDIYLATGDPYYETLMPNVMLRNDHGRRFEDVTMSGGFGHLQKGHGIAFADIDHDGDQDIYHQLGGFFPGDAFHNALFVNPGNDHQWIKLKLIGTKTNRSAVGARVRVVAHTPEGLVSYHRLVGCGSSFGGSTLRQEIGLGRATAVEKIEVRWPTSGTTQVFKNVSINSMIRITEGDNLYETVSLKPMKLN